MKTIDLFAGCGGMSLGFQNVGYDIEAAFDNWKPAIEVYRANFQHPIFEVDLSQNCEILSKFSPQIIIGGSPCQDFSSAGKRDENLGRGDLTLRFAEIIAQIKPEFFVMENVPLIAKSERLKKAKNVLYSADYGLTEKVLDASFCGVPQTRKRFFLVGKLNADVNFLDYYFEKNLRVKPTTLFDYFGKNLGIENYYRHPRSYARRGVFSIYEPSPTIRGVNRPVPKTYIKHPQDTCEIDENLRPLTTAERALIQTFPQDFKFFGSKTDLEQMIGNAVPVKLAEFVAKCIKEYQTDLVENREIKAKQLAFHF